MGCRRRLARMVQVCRTLQRQRAADCLLAAAREARRGALMRPCPRAGRVQVSPVPGGGPPPAQRAGVGADYLPHEALGHRRRARKEQVLVRDEPA